MDNSLFNIISLATVLIFALIARHLIPLIKNRANFDDFAQLLEWIDAAVQYAQQTMYDETGAEKKTAVLELITDYCKKKGINITAEQLDVLIESAVKQLKMAENASGASSVSPKE